MILVFTLVQLLSKAMLGSYESTEELRSFMHKLKSWLGQIWEPLSELRNAQEEAHTVARYLDTEAMVGPKVTKEALLSELPKSTLIHLGEDSEMGGSCFGL